MRYLFLSLIFVFCFNSVFCKDYLSIDEIKPGMKGYGLSVFKGWEPEKFDVEIIDVIKNTSPKRSYILARLSGQNLEKTGVIAGMSGSPVYVDGKIVGAVAYTWSFSKEPICGITPLENMLEEKKYVRSKEKQLSGENDKFFKKITTPIFISGFPGPVKSYLESFFSTNTFLNPVMILESSKMSDSSLKNTERTLKPGDAVAINLVEGDLNLEAIGTVTYTNNDEVFIFGHPMNGDGFVSLPISRGYIFTTIPSSYLSFKLGASSTPVGSTVYDGQNAVYCRTGKEADMVPFYVTVREGEVKNSYSFNVVDNKNFFPNLSTAALVASILNQTGYMDEKRINMSFLLNFKASGKDYAITNKIVYSYYPSFYNFLSLVSDLNSFFSIFYYNEISDLKISKCLVDIEIEPEAFYYVLDSAGIDRKIYEPGDMIRLKVVMKAFKGNYITKFLYLKIPDDIKNGQYNLIVGSEAAVYSELRRSFPFYFRIAGIEDLIYWGSFKINPANLVAAIVIPRQGIVVLDKKLTSFPEVYADFFQSTTDKTYIPVFPEVFSQTISMDGTVFSSFRLIFNVGQVKTERQE
ncbi:MAG: SpoIVB peptidase S55 domain-containing protein [Brevinematia bacterium]